MSQQPMEQQDATGIPGEEDHFAEGLAEALKDDEQPEDSSQQPEDAGGSTHHESAPQDVTAGIEAPEAAPMPQEPPAPSPAGTPRRKRRRQRLHSLPRSSCLKSCKPNTSACRRWIPKQRRWPWKTARQGKPCVTGLSSTVRSLPMTMPAL